MVLAEFQLLLETATEELAPVLCPLFLLTIWGFGVCVTASVSVMGEGCVNEI